MPTLERLDVYSAATGTSRPADVFVCDCGSSSFLAFQIVGQRHLHLQCDRCGVSFCPAGACR